MHNYSVVRRGRETMHRCIESLQKKEIGKGRKEKGVTK